MTDCTSCHLAYHEIGVHAPQREETTVVSGNGARSSTKILKGAAAGLLAAAGLILLSVADEVMHHRSLRVRATRYHYCPDEMDGRG